MSKPINIAVSGDANNNLKLHGEGLAGTGSVGLAPTQQQLTAATYYATLPSNVPGTPSSPVANNSTYEVIPHRIFVGGFAAGTTEHELRSFFEAYGTVREVKVIKNPEGSSKGYGFVTFENETEAQNVRGMDPDKLEFKGRRLNLGPAMRRINYGMSSPAAPFYQAPAYQYAVPQYLMDPAAAAYAVAAQPTAYPPSPTYLVVPQNQYLHPAFSAAAAAGYATPVTPTQQQQQMSSMGVAVSAASQPRLLSTVTNKLTSPVKQQQQPTATAAARPMHGGAGVLGNTAITRTPTRASAGAEHSGSLHHHQQQRMQQQQQHMMPKPVGPTLHGGEYIGIDVQEAYMTQQHYQQYQQQLKQSASDTAMAQAQQQHYASQMGYATATPAQQQQHVTIYPTPNTPSMQQHMPAMSSAGYTTAVPEHGIRALSTHYNNDFYTNELIHQQQQHSIDHDPHRLSNAMDSLKM